MTTEHVKEDSIGAEDSAYKAGHETQTMKNPDENPFSNNILQSRLFLFYRDR
jgi:hypothetical protein